MDASPPKPVLWKCFECGATRLYAQGAHRCVVCNKLTIQLEMRDAGQTAGAPSPHAKVIIGVIDSVYMTEGDRATAKAALAALTGELEAARQEAADLESRLWIAREEVATHRHVVTQLSAARQEADTLRSQLEEALAVLVGGPTAADAHKSPVQRVMDAQTILRRAAARVAAPREPK